MVDWIRPLKIEYGDEIDSFPTEVNPIDDGILAQGLAIENTSTKIEKDGDGNMLFTDSNAGNVTLSTLKNKSWNQLINKWTIEPTEVTYSNSDGDVYQYQYGSTIYYRFVPEPYDSTLDSFYETYNDPNLSGLVATRGESI